MEASSHTPTVTQKFWFTNSLTLADSPALNSSVTMKIV